MADLLSDFAPRGVASTAGVSDVRAGLATESRGHCPLARSDILFLDDKIISKVLRPHAAGPLFFVEWWLRGEVVTSERVTSLAWCLRKARETKKGSKSKF